MRSNFATVRPELSPAELDALVRAGLRSYMRYWCDSFRLPDRSVEDLVHGVRAVGDEPVRTQLESGRSAVIFLGHMGNWDFGGAWSTTQLAPVTTVANGSSPRSSSMSSLPSVSGWACGSSRSPVVVTSSGS